MSGYNSHTHDGLILLGSDRRKGIWASETIYRGSRTFKQAGQLPTCTTTHGLELVALATALRSITNAQSNRIMMNVPRQFTKPRLEVLTTDPTFADAIQAATQGDSAAPTTKPLRAGKNFLLFAFHQMARFHLTFGNQPDNDNSVRVLNSWAAGLVMPQKLIATVPAGLIPTAVSAVL